MVKRPRYYCDHCGKGSGNPGAMRKHERGCTKNPERVCGMCPLMPEPAAPREELLRILDADGFEPMREAARDCPACILSALRMRDDDSQDGRWAWDYNRAKKKFWNEYTTRPDDL